MYLMVMKHINFLTITGAMPNKVSAKNFLTEVHTDLLNRIKLRPSRILARWSIYAITEKKHKGVHYGNA